MPSWPHGLVFVLLLGSIFRNALTAQAPEGRWRLGVVRSWYALAPRYDAGTGLGLLVQRRVAGSLALDLAVSGVTRSGGDYQLTGALLEAGLNLSRRWRLATLSGGGGLVAMRASDEDGYGTSGVGPYAAAQVTLWPARSLGVTGRLGLYGLTRDLARSSLMLGVAFSW